MKYIIDIEDIPFIRDESLYRAKGFKSLVFDKIGLEKLTPYKPVDPDAIEKARKAGQDEAWELAYKLDAMFIENWKECFNKTYTTDHKQKMSYAETREKYEAWKKKQKEEIHVGDEVAFHHEFRPDTVIVVTHIGYDGFVNGMDDKGTLFAQKSPIMWQKTGRHFPEVAELLEKLRKSEC